MESKITLSLTLEEVNAVLGALGKFPFEQVADLIKNVHAQASSQIQPEAPAAE